MTRRIRRSERARVLRWIGIVLVVLGGCTGRPGPGVNGRDTAAGPSERMSPPSATPSTPDDGWTTASPGAAGLDPGRLERMSGAIRGHPDWNVHAVLIERDGRLVYEEYFAGTDERWGRSLGHVQFDRTPRHDLRSVSKSVVSVLVGTALGAGALRSVDQPLLGFFPDYSDLADPERARLTLRHALTMSPGLDWNERVPYTSPANDEIGMTMSADPIRYVLSRPIVLEPGRTWNYNGGLTQVLATIVQRSTGRPFEAYARSVLFEPLGITDVEWVGNLGGIRAAASGLRLRPGDVAKIGSLYLHGGRWQGRQIVPAEWGRESTRRHVSLPVPAGRTDAPGYGYHGTVEYAAALGNGQQRVYVLPALRMVATILAGRYNDRSLALGNMLLTEHIVPASPPADASKAPTPSGCPAA